MSYLKILALGLFSGCTQPQPDFPERASQIEGIYKADTYSNKIGISGIYPIQGQTMTLKLTTVSADSIQVEIEATPNGDYSPGSNRSYRKVLVNQEFDTDIINGKQQTCLIYSVDMPQTSGLNSSHERLRRLCRISGIHYYFTAPVSKSEALVYFAIQ